MNKKILLHRKIDYISKKIPHWDSGLLERFSSWQYFYHISRFFDSSLVLDTYCWPEALVLDFPNTEIVENFNLEKTKSIFLDNNFLIKTLNDLMSFGNTLQNTDNQKIHYELMRYSSDNSIFEDSNLVYFEYDWVKDFNIDYEKLLDFIDTYSNSYDIFKEIKFKDDRVNKFFKDNFSDSIAVHLRRGVGGILNQKYIDDLKQHVDPKTIKKYYSDLHLIGGYGLYPIATDDYYFERIDKILSETPDKKIYVSYDVPRPFINNFLEKYPKNIISKVDYLDEYLSYFSHIDFNSNKYFLSIRKSLIDLLDLFALSHSGTFIFNNRYNQSSWIFFANNYVPKKLIH
jgi:hypothetical protein